jgi:hypothetical protein
MGDGSGDAFGLMVKPFRNPRFDEDLLGWMVVRVVVVVVVVVVVIICVGAVPSNCLSAAARLLGFIREFGLFGGASAGGGVGENRRR